jgi:ligand-binding sensor domain-containing protein
MVVDDAGTLWTLGQCRGLCSHDGTDWTVHVDPLCWDPVWEPEPEMEYPGMVMALTVDRSGAAVISTDQGGLLAWDGAEWVSITGFGVGPAVATEIAFGPDGSVWALEGSDTLYVLRHGSWLTIPFEPLGIVWVSTVTVDEEGVVWVGTESGLFRYGA